MHSKIGDIFPEEFKKKYYDRKLEVGSILLLDANIIGIPKKKFIVLSGFDENFEKVALVLINSNPNQNIFTEKLRRESHFKIYKKNYQDILTKDSYIDCTKLHECSKEIIINLLCDDEKIFKGQLNKEDINKMRELIYYCELITPYERKKYGLNKFP